MKEQILLSSISLKQLTEIISCAVRKAVKEAAPPEQSKPVSDKKMTGIAGASSITGYTKNTIYSLVHRRRIPFHKAKGGSKLIFDVAELEEWVRSSDVSREKDLGRINKDNIE